MDRKLDKEMLWQWGKLVLLCLVALALLALAILELLPSPKAGIEVKTPFAVSSQKIRADGSLYSTEIRGTLRNGGDDPIRVDRVTVTVGDGKTKTQHELGSVLLPQGAERELVLLFEGSTDLDTVYEVSALVGDTEYRLANRASSSIPVSGLALWCAVLLIPVAFFTVRAAQGCYYLAEERKNFG